MEKTHYTFGSLLQQAREAAGLTREALAQLVKLDTSYVYRIETGARRPSRESVLQFADALKIEGEAVNQWLQEAGYAPMPLLTSVRSAVRTRGAIRTRGRRQEHNAVITAGWDTTQWAGWLAAMGLEEPLIRRLLHALESASREEQDEVTRIISTTMTRAAESLETPVHCAVIPAAGGQHQILAAHVMQRLLLRAISEASESGITKIILVLAPGMVDALYTPLRQAFELSIAPAIQLQYVVQARPNGLGDAILQTESLIGQQPFAVLLPDDVVQERTGRALYARELRRMIEAYKQVPEAHLIAAAPVPKARLLQSGVIKVAKNEVHPALFSVTRLVEKPPASHAILRASHTYGIVGRYLLQPTIFEALRALQAECPLHLTTALERLRQKGLNIYAFTLKATRQDIGGVLDQANVLIGTSPELSFTN